MLSSANISDTKNQLFVLSKFALEYPRLEAAGALLPELLEFYRWIHIELAYRVTFKYAENHTIQDVIEKADDEYKRRDMKETKGFELPQLYEKVKGNFYSFKYNVTSMCLLLIIPLLNQLATTGMWRWLVALLVLVPVQTSKGKVDCIASKMIQNSFTFSRILRMKVKVMVTGYTSSSMIWYVTHCCIHAIILV